MAKRVTLVQVVAHGKQLITILFRTRFGQWSLPERRGEALKIWKISCARKQWLHLRRKQLGVGLFGGGAGHRPPPLDPSLMPHPPAPELVHFPPLRVRRVGHCVVPRPWRMSARSGGHRREWGSGESVSSLTSS